MQGDPGRLWSDEPTPWVAGGESFQRWIGRGGPRAQERYFAARRASSLLRVVGLVIGGAVVTTALLIALTSW